MNPDEQTFQVVFTALFDFTPLNVNMLKPELFPFYEGGQIKPQ